MDAFEECPLYHQILMSETFQKSHTGTSQTADWLLDKLIIIDFGSIFRRDVTSAEIDAEQRRLQDMVRKLMEQGLDIQFEEHCVHMIPFEKSGNMSRQSRITFLNEAYYAELNERLNLGMGFSKMSVISSKYYAYRGLYLTSSRRIRHEKLELTPETLVIVKDIRYIMAANRVYFFRAHDVVGSSPTMTETSCSSVGRAHVK